MKLPVPALILVLLFQFNLNAQNNDTTPDRFWDHVRFGGGLSMGFGSSYSSIAISPSAIYDFSDYFSAGLSGKYIYYKQKGTVSEAVSMYGGSLLTLVRPLNGVQLSAEYERLELSNKLIFQDAIPSAHDALYIGAEWVTGNIAMGLRYDVLYDKRTNILYPSALTPVFRVYF